MARIKAKVKYFVTHRNHRFHCILLKLSILLHCQIASSLSKAQKFQIFRLWRAKIGALLSFHNLVLRGVEKNELKTKNYLTNNPVFKTFIFGVDNL